MSEPTFIPYKDGKLLGTIYTFAEAGDILSMHTHTKDDVHNTFVVSGEIEAYGPERIWSGIYGPGTIISFAEGQWHEFAATKANTKIVNILK